MLQIQDIVGWTPVAFKDGGTSAAPLLDPLATKGVIELICRWAQVWVMRKHPCDDLLQRVWVLVINHEGGWVDASTSVALDRGDVEAPQRLVFGICGRVVRVVRVNRVTVDIAVEVALSAPSEAGEVREIAAAQSLPGFSVLGHGVIACNLAHDNTECKDIVGLVIPSLESFRGKEMPVTLAVNVGGGWPGSRQTKVGNLEHAIEGNEDVGRFEVEMDIAVVVNVANALLL